LSRTWRLGRSILESRKNKSNPLKIIEQQEGGKLVFTGKIVDVDREAEQGYNKGKLVIAGFDEYVNKTVTIDFQNENLIATLCEDDQPKDKKIIGIVPDLIVLVDFETYQPFLCEEFRYGLRTSILLLPSAPKLRSPTALKVIGPEAFGYECDYKPISDYIEPKSVIDEYAPCPPPF